MVQDRKADFERLRLDLVIKREEFQLLRDRFLNLINGELHRCYLNYVSAVSEATARDYGPGVCIDFAPFEPLRKKDIPESLEGLKGLSLRVGDCSKALELVERLECELFRSEKEISTLKQMLAELPFEYRIE